MRNFTNNSHSKIKYIVKGDVEKTACLFPAKVISGEIIRQESEINQIKWLPFEEAIDTVSYDNAKKMLKDALEELGYIK